VKDIPRVAGQQFRRKWTGGANLLFVSLDGQGSRTLIDLIPVISGMQQNNHFFAGGETFSVTRFTAILESKF
jgi:hypothetical protein